MAKLTHWKKLTNPNYLGAYSIEDGKDLILTIRNVKQEVVIGSDGKQDECIVCYFQEDVKPMILNSTNCTTIANVTGTPYVEKWAGHRIKIEVKKVRAFGAVVDALRVSNQVVKSTQPSSITVVCEKCGKPITAIGQYSAADIVRINEQRFGKKLCGDCSKKMSAESMSDKPKEEQEAPKAAETEGQEELEA